MDISRLYVKYMKDNEETKEVSAAEETMEALNKKLRSIDKELAFEFDQAVGRITWAYEKQGVGGGFAAAKELL